MGLIEADQIRRNPLPLPHPHHVLVEVAVLRYAALPREVLAHTRAYELLPPGAVGECLQRAAPQPRHHIRRETDFQRETEPRFVRPACLIPYLPGCIPIHYVETCFTNIHEMA
jgi:hypothetical protein